MIVTVQNTGVPQAIDLVQEYAFMRGAFYGKQFQQYLALEAMKNGNILRTANTAWVSRNDTVKGVAEIKSGDVYTRGVPIRKAGGGRKRTVPREASRQPMCEDERHASIRAAKGRFAHAHTSSEEFVRWKHEGTEREEVRFRRISSVLSASSAETSASRKALIDYPVPDMPQVLQQIIRSLLQVPFRGQPMPVLAGIWRSPTSS